MEDSLLRQVKELKKEVTIRRRSDLLKYESLSQIVGSLGKSQKNIRKDVEEL